MTGDDELEPRPNIRWANDFGPETLMWQRYIMAGACMALVIAFLAMVIFLLGDPPGPDNRAPDGLWETAAFIAGLLLAAVIGLFGERRAIRIRRFFARRFGGPGTVERRSGASLVKIDPS